MKTLTFFTLLLSSGCAYISDGDTKSRIDADGDGFNWLEDCDDENGGLTEVVWYIDTDGDGFGSENNSVVSCSEPEGSWSNIKGDCQDEDSTINPTASEICDGLDNNCDGWMDDLDDNIEPSQQSTYYLDADGDSYIDAFSLLRSCNEPEDDRYIEIEGDLDSSNVDCDDSDASINPSDFDGDGYNTCPNGGIDCDDQNTMVYPTASEICDGLDNNCDNQVDEGLSHTHYLDADGDGFGDFLEGICVESSMIAPDNYVEDNTDCDDSNVQKHPLISEICDDIDNNCDGQIDEGVKIILYYDSDGDGYGSNNNKYEECEAPTDPNYIEESGDCDDNESLVNPQAAEICDGGIDNNCDGIADFDAINALTWYEDTDGDGQGNPEVTQSRCTQPIGYVTSDQDCDDTTPQTYVGAAYLDSVVHCMQDLDGDGYGDTGSTTSTYISGSDCDDTDATVYPSASELCDGKVNACGGSLPSNETDDDGDGFVECSIDTNGWDGVSSVTNGEDCDDGNDTIYPNAPELCDGEVNTCGGSLPANETDDDGDGQVECSIDVNGWDGDPSITSGDDCDDGNDSVYANALEICDGQINTCGSSLPSNEIDDDGDGFVECSIDVNGWDGVSSVTNGEDCDDGNDTVYPNAPELCDGQLNTCGGSLPANEIDNDGDGQVECTIDANGWDGISSVISGNDCDDNDVDVFVGSAEFDGSSLCMKDADNDGYGEIIQSDGDNPPSYESGTDCDDSTELVNPSMDEVCDGIDNNCDDVVDDDAIDRITWYFDFDIDGQGDPLFDTILSCDQPTDYVDNDDDCYDDDAFTFLGSAELDDVLACMRDADDDGYGDSNANGTLPASVAVGTDCNDNDASINPSAPDDSQDGIDQNCNGVDFDICENLCISEEGFEMHNDGSCDDGGPQADYNVCALGSDCNDCGPRSYSDEACTDGQDNDGDQLIDCDDPDCAELNSCGPN